MKESTAYFKRKLLWVKERTRLTGNELIREGLTHLLFFACAFFCSRAGINEKYLPFGLSAAAGTPFSYMPAAGLGAMLGYIFPVTGEGGFRYIAAVLSIMAIRLLTAKIKFTRESPLFATFITLLSAFFTGVATLRGLPGGVAFAGVEAALAGGGAYFLHKGSLAALNSETGLSNQQLTCFVISLSVVLAGLSRLSVGGISVGRVIFIVFILVAAHRSGAGAGAVFGVAASLSASSVGAPSAALIMLGFGGLMAGVFSDIGKLSSAFAFIGASLIGAIMGGFSANTSLIIVEAVIGCGLFLLMPKTVTRKLSKLFAEKVAVMRPEGLKKALTMRLSFAGNALHDVSSTVEQVSEQLSKINSPDFKKVLSRIEEDACKGCSMRVFCWETKHESTIEAVISMTKAVRSGETTPERFCDEEFRLRCIRSARMGNAAYKYYTEYASAIAAEKRIEEVRSVVTDQFSGISKMLISLSKEFENEEKYDGAAASRIAAALKNLDIVTAQCGVRLDKFDRMTVDIWVKNSRDIVLNRAEIMNALCVACDRDFDPPCITFSGGDAYISAAEHATLTAEIGVEQICSSENSICGDSYEYFFDGKGRLIMILSDGMGTGGRAAVDGAMASGLMSRLLKAGFDYDAALRILNSAMLFKSTDESLATLDVTAVDLFTGKTYLLKAGAAPTIVRRSGRAGKAQSTSLPAGILRGVTFDRAVITMKKGDIILMLSDGAVSEGTDWISAEIEGWTDGSAQALAERIAKCARRRRTDKKQDDITVIAAILKNA
ncbi:MAG: SpoIIE family protein phosphatase [Clostridia bacterium]|nr:SpoIIE family protein phosphatase [Clostridia bacterium]